MILFAHLPINMSNSVCLQAYKYQEYNNKHPVILKDQLQSCHFANKEQMNKSKNTNNGPSTHWKDKSLLGNADPERNKTS